VLKKIKLLLLLLFLTITINQTLAQKFAVIGDYGNAGVNDLAVANLVKSWNPDFIITVGDNNYDYGEAPTIDQNIGQYYADWIFPYSGIYGMDTATTNRFFPVPGNHDWDSDLVNPKYGLDPYLDYFTLPDDNDERYYDFVWGDVHFFMIDSDEREPDGNTDASVQALWIKNKMETSTAKWKVVVLHHAPYSSSGSTSELRWPFKTWGADVVLAGHKHNYERLKVDDLIYFVDGLGGKSRQSFNTPRAESIVRYMDDYGAMLVEATFGYINFSFYNTSSTMIDTYEITDPTPVELAYFAGTLNGNKIDLRWRTETEVNNYGFDIERSPTSLGTSWETIGYVEAHGNSNSPKQYSFSDSDIGLSAKYYYRLKQIDNDGTYEYSDVVSVEFGVPNNFYLNQNYPNPFNPETRIDFTLSEKQLVSLRVYNTLGELVIELVNEQREAGSYSAMFDASSIGGGLPSGVYIYRLQASEFVDNKKMILLK
jgi:hypothetical protein